FDLKDFHEKDGITMGKIRVGMIGTGGIAHWHARQLKELEDAVIVAITDPSAQNRERIISEHQLEGVIEFTDHKEMLANSELDAVVICSPHTLHFQQAMDVLNSGCHVLIEKPMACSQKEADELIETA